VKEHDCNKKKEKEDISKGKRKRRMYNSIRIYHFDEKEVVKGKSQQ